MNAPGTHQRILMGCVLLTLCFGLWSCAPTLIAGGTTGGYMVGTDERSAGNMMDDAAITARIKYELLKAPGVSSMAIDVDTVEGQVTLTGLVSSHQEGRQALRIAHSVPGVRKVIDNLKLGGRSLGGSFDDTLLASKIKTALIETPGIHAFNIDIDVNRGIVTLTGIVDDETQRARVLHIARRTPGVKGVHDILNVRHP